ncbi:MAG TPA: hemolysin III family protein, partial [Saprospiraceae bacterium]|nr:hemolysin III family protein [Saprospiraceae bacterium]
MSIDHLKSCFAQISAKEQANVLTHAIGLLLVILCCPLLLMSEPVHEPWFGLVIFIIGMTFTYFSSAYYHLHPEGIVKDKWRIVDHISIFILIGSTYTPFILFYYNVPEGNTFLFIHWMIILGGILFKLIFKDKYEVFSLTLY